MLLKKNKFIIISVIVVSAAIYVYWLFQRDDKVDFNTQIRPILNSKCTSCHGGVKNAGGISFIYREEALGIGKSGKICIVPGKPEESEFIKRIKHHDPELRMPLGKVALNEDEIKLLSKWIKQGAEWQDHWAFVKPKPQEVPQKDGWGENFIDFFIHQKAKSDNVSLSPSPEADKATLLRRLSLDITGLPPNTKELENFLEDKSTNAYEKVVDRLLSSSRYGERWTAMWLDLARYADSKGYEKDQYRNIWRFRDYLIKSINEDKGYDQMTKEMLAGDLLPKPSEEQLIATAFHRNTLNNDEGGSDTEEFRTAAVIDRLNTTFDVWQGITIGCTQCHSHPYDPIKHKEYYGLFDYFNQTKDVDNPDETPVHFSQKDFDFIKANSLVALINKPQTVLNKNDFWATAKQMRRTYLDDLRVVDADIFYNITKDEKKISPLAEGAYVCFKKVQIPYNFVPEIGYNIPNNKGMSIEVRIDKPNGNLIARYDLETSYDEMYWKKGKFISNASGIHDIYYIFKKNKNLEIVGSISAFKFASQNPQKNSNLDSIRRELRKALAPEGTPIMQDLPSESKRITRLFVRGSYQNLADTVTANIPAIFGSLPSSSPKNRLGLANWLVSDENPLTARVAVNRYWEQIFGAGIVETLEDFGSQGSKPTHPELLDYLAIYFAKDCNWSMKKLLKTILMSQTYRQQSIISVAALEKDPKNKYLLRGARFRLTSEQIRDQALAVSGLLSKKMYGPSVMPHQPDGIWQTVYSGTKWTTSAGEDKHRRAIYTYIRRSAPYPSYITFDNPSREFCLVRRIRTNTPLQALVTLNDTVYTEASIALALKGINKSNDISRAIEEMYYQAMLKKPSTKTSQALNKLYETSYAHYSTPKTNMVKLISNPDKPDQNKLKALSIVGSAIINLDEFLNKE